MIHFVKAHACGNDFLIVDDPLEEREYPELARRLCERHTGIGADGVEYLSLDTNGGYIIRLFNADGSEAEISGNGTRCVAAWLAQQEDLESVALHTLAGLRRCRILERDHPRYRISTEMGIPEVHPHTLHLDDGSRLEGLKVSIGNPHFVFFIGTGDFSVNGKPWQELGEQICTHKDFPHGTNAEFVRVLDSSSIEFRIYERGAGPTQSSGTGSSASAAAAIFARDTARSLTVIAEGGPQTVEWPNDRSPLLLTGPAEIIAQGESWLG
jgi:diaminopimelate epimerase